MIRRDNKNNHRSGTHLSDINLVTSKAVMPGILCTPTTAGVPEVLVIKGDRPTIFCNDNCRVLIERNGKTHEWYVAGYDRDVHFILVPWILPEIVHRYQRNDYVKITATIVHIPKKFYQP